MNSVVVYSKDTTAEAVATVRKVSTLTLIHSCHRPRIPFGHVLIERRCLIKHCKKRGCNKEKKYQPTRTHKKGTVSKTQNNKTCENCRIHQNTPQRKAPWPQRGSEREYTYFVPYLSPQTHPKYQSPRTDGQ